MKKLLKSAVVWTAIICLIPAAAAGGRKAEPVSAPAAAAVQEETYFRLPSDTLKILTETSEIREISIEEYTVYALLEEIPFIMEKEALKAQAAAARTYAARRIMAGENEQGVHITRDSSLYQTCLDEKTAQAVYGDDYEAALEAAREAADETCGQIITKDGVPIIAAFCISSAGVTESAENVWGAHTDYLVPAASEGDIYSPYYRQERFFTGDELTGRMLADYADATAFDKISCEYSPSGTVLTAQLCGISLKGSELAHILSLESAAFEVRQENGGVIFTVSGSGHLAGMSMYGANYMAKQGADYKEIIAHYYNGAEITGI